MKVDKHAEFCNKHYADGIKNNLITQIMFPSAHFPSVSTYHLQVLEATDLFETIEATIVLPLLEFHLNRIIQLFISGLFHLAWSF